MFRSKGIAGFQCTPFKIDPNINQNRSIDKVQKLGNERRYIYKDPRQDLGQRNISYTRYPKKCFIQTYREDRETPCVLVKMSARIADIPCITQVTLKIIHNALLIHKGWLVFPHFDFILDFPTRVHGADVYIDLTAEVS